MDQNNKQFKKYTTFLQNVIEYTKKSWLAGEGEFRVIVTDESGTVNGAIKGGDTFRTKKLDSEEGE